MQLKTFWLRSTLVAATFLPFSVAQLPAQTIANGSVKTVSHCSNCQTGCQSCAPCAPGATYAAPSYGTMAPMPTAVPGDSGEAMAPVVTAAPTMGDFSQAANDFTAAPNAFSAVGSANTASASSFALAAVGGYIEPASIQNRFRVSWSDFKRSDSPDRAQYFYGYADSSNALIGLGAGVLAEGPDYNALVDGNGQVREPSFSEVRTYFEHTLWNNNVSLFIDVPFRHTSGFDFGDGDTGIGDIQIGSRVSLYETCDFALTGIAKAYLPTGNVARARSTGHASIEYGFLFQKQVNENLQVFGQVTDWFSTEDTLLNGDTGNANVLQYGLGIGYQIYDGCCGNRRFTITPVAEFVGWSVLDGKKTAIDVANNSFAFEDADGDFIANGKYGVRMNMGQSSFYGGYGHNLTDEHWYREIVRFEYTRTF